VSDIVSKSLGGLILFEPFHPAVLTNAESFMYSDGSSGLFDDALDHAEKIINGRLQERWLLRNHLPRDLDHSAIDFEETLWRECAILGFKEIRLNLMLPLFRQKSDYKLVFVVRHPLSVLASIKKRSRFWLEFGFDIHYQKFITETFDNSLYRDMAIQRNRFWLDRVESDLEKATLMWAVTHELLLMDLHSDSVYLLEYGELYRNPFAEVTKLLAFLGHEGCRLHPSYLFTPSMTTHRTLHGAKEMDAYLVEGETFFWKDVLTESELCVIRKILESFLSPVIFDLYG
jgi:hypothetical protein